MRTAHDVVTAYWAAAQARDWHAFGDLVTMTGVSLPPCRRARNR
jgi:hypothetical protein